MQRTWLTAHSGCDGTEDNSLAFLSYAMRLNVDCIEVDVRMSANGILVLTHDDGPTRTILADAFAMLSEHPGKKFNCDLKQDGLENNVYALAREFGVHEQLVFSGCVSPEAASQNPRLFMHAGWFLNIENLFPQVKFLGFSESVNARSAERMADSLQQFISCHPVRCINTHHMIHQTPLYGILMKRNIPMSVWTPDVEQLILRFLEDGVFNITTRNARRACELAGRSPE